MKLWRLRPEKVFFQWDRKLRAGKFDLALVLPNSPRSALEVFLARIPRHIGYARPWRSFFLTRTVAARTGAAKMRKLSVAEIQRRIATENTRARRAEIQNSAISVPLSAVVAYKQAFGFDAPPYTYQDLEESDCIVLIGANPCIAHPVLWERVTRNPHAPGDHRRRPAPDRDGDGGHAPPPGPPEVGPDAAVRTRAAADRAGRDRPPRSSTPTRRASTSSRRSSASSTRTAWRARPAWAPRRFATPPTRIARGRRVSFWWTMGVNQSHQGVQDGPGRDQPGPDDRQHRPAGDRGQLDHRPVQRDGLAALLEHDEPAGRPRLHQPRPPRRGRRAARHSRASASRPSRAGRTTGSSTAIRAGKIRGLWVVATNPAHSWIDQNELRETLGQARLPGRAGHVPLDRDGRAGRPAAAGGGLGREGGDVHQLGAPGRPDQEGPPRSGPGALGFPHFQAGRRIITAVARCSRSGSRPRRSSRFSSGSRRAALRHHAASPTTASSTRRGASSGPTRPENPDPSHERRLFADGRFYHPDGRARFLFEEPQAVARAAGREFPVPAPDRPRQRGAVAHPDADGQVGRPPQALPARPLRRDQPRRRRGRSA